MNFYELRNKEAKTSYKLFHGILQASLKLSTKEILSTELWETEDHKICYNALYCVSSDKLFPPSLASTSTRLRPLLSLVSKLLNMYMA